MPTTHRTARRAIADQTGGFLPFTITQAPAASDPDARRTLISSDLVDEDFDPTAFNDAVVYSCDWPTAGEQKAVRRDVFDGASGILSTSGLFSVAPKVGQEFELHTRLPAIRTLKLTKGLREVVNEALSILWFEDEYVYAATSGQTYAPPSWLTNQKQVIGLKDAAVMAGSIPLRSARTAALVHDGTGRSLQISSPYGTGTAFRVVGRRPHRTWVYTGGAWGDSEVGLVEDDDMTLADESQIKIVGTWLAYRALNASVPAGVSKPFMLEEAQWEAKAADLVQWGLGDTSTPLAPGQGGGEVWAKGGSPSGGWY